MVKIDNKQQKGLTAFKEDIVRTIKHIFGNGVDVSYTSEVNVQRAKNYATAKNNKPEGATDDTYIIGFKSRIIGHTHFVEDLAEYAQKVLKDYPQFVYRGTVSIGNTNKNAIIYFDIAEQPVERTPLEAIAAEYKSTGRKQFIEDLIETARKLGIEEQIAQAWVKK